MIDGRKMPAGAIIFTHLDEVTGVETVFSVTHLWWKAHKELARGTLHVGNIFVDQKFAKWCKSNRGLEKHRLNRIKTRHLKEPVLMLSMPNESTLLVDGHHRFVKAANLMKRTLPAVIMPLGMWEDCVVVGLPPSSEEDLQTGFSGIF